MYIIIHNSTIIFCFTKNKKKRKEESQGYEVKLVVKRKPEVSTSASRAWFLVSIWQDLTLKM